MYKRVLDIEQSFALLDRYFGSIAADIPARIRYILAERDSPWSSKNEFQIHVFPY